MSPLLIPPERPVPSTQHALTCLYITSEQKKNEQTTDSAMDLDTIDPRSIDVAHTVSKLSFRFYSDKEALRLSVRRLTSPQAFDELGRPIPRGLYDPALGPTSYSDGPCETCGLSYNSCPGHFGHVELPIPIINPLLIKTVLCIIKSTCWSCPCLLLLPSDLNLLLARLYFEDAGMPKCGYAVEAFRGLRRRQIPKDSVDATENTDKETIMSQLVFNWHAFFQGLPSPLCDYVQDLDSNDFGLVDKRMLQSARLAWRKAQAKGNLAQHRSPGWKHAKDQILSATTGARCPLCFRKAIPVRLGDRGRLFRRDSHGETLLSPTQLNTHMAALWEIHEEVFEMLFGLKGRDVSNGEKNLGHLRLFVRNVLVPPSRFRPASKVGNMTYAAEHPQNMFFQRLLTEIEVIMRGNEFGLDDGEVDKSAAGAEDDVPYVERPTKARFAQAMSNMQEALRDLYDSSGRTGGGRIQMTGIRQQLEAKSGLFRQHMMGKRVNFSCRSVIGPDVFLDTDEVGIPESFAKALTVPEPVIPMNVKQMQLAVLNGPSVYPGAIAVEDWTSSGAHRVVKFMSSTPKKRLEAQASLLIQNRFAQNKNHRNGRANFRTSADGIIGDAMSNRAGIIPKQVHRHLKTGDIILFNRQPTLHRVSIMAHRVRVLPGERTIRFHYANCGSYNADFDGDEMNIHIPQDYLARAEAEELMLSSKHYIVPTSGAPIRGLIQDHIAAAVLLSHRDTFIEREEFMQLLYAATEKLMSQPHRSCEKYALPCPAILKPRRLWTGKQLISTVLFVVRDGRPGLSLIAGTKTKADIIGSEEAQIVFRDGQLLQGIVDKSSIGSSMYGIVHAVQEAYGCDASDDFLSAMSRLCVFFMRSHGHSTDVEDLMLQEEGERKRRQILSQGIEDVGVKATNAVYTEMSKGAKHNLSLAKTPSEARLLVEDMIRRDGDEAEDRLDTAMKSALNKVSSSVMKECVPASLKKSFPLNGFALMTNTGAKGSAVNAAQISCLLGSTVLEGKRVPRMGGSGATLPCFAPFDAAPNAGGFISGRFLTGVAPQEFFFHAMSGREGLLDTSLKTANSGYLQRCLVKHMEGIRLHYDYTVRDSDNSVVQFIYGDDGIDPSKSRWLNEKVGWQVENENCLRVSANKNGDNEKSLSESGRCRASTTDTLIEHASPGALSRLGAISESYNDAVQKAEKHNRSKVRPFLEERYRAAALEPGEAVGVVAAQGVGEPSTQMTLNTFHHAGSSSAHVTLGIPRLRELLLTASKYPRTPSMTLPVQGKSSEESAKDLSRRLQKISLLDLMIEVLVVEMGFTVVSGVAAGASDITIRNIEISLRFPREEVYGKQLGFGFSLIQTFVADEFLPAFDKRLRWEIRRVSSDSGKRVPQAISTYLSVATKPEYLDSQHSNTSNIDVGNANDYLVPGSDEHRDSADEHEGDSDDDRGSSSDEELDEDSEEGNGDGRESRKQVKSMIEGHDDADDTLIEEESMGTVERRKSKKRPKAKKRIRQENGTVEPDGFDNYAVGKMGYTPGSFKDVGGRKLFFRWAIPALLLGKLDIAALVKETASNLMVKEVKQISRCFIESTTTGHSVITEGSNIQAILEIGMDLVNFNLLETNDMYGILNRYGVEALRTALIQEFVKVFEAYGIPVNVRHLRLIADYMTAHGGYRGFNRNSMDGTPSAFQRITFETSVNFLTEGAMNGTEDYMKNPSAAIAMGQLYEGGTGGFQLLQEIN